MNLMHLLLRAGPKQMWLLALSAGGTALATTMVMAIVNAAAAEIAEQNADFVDLTLGVLFVVALVGFFFSQSWLTSLIASDVEQGLEELRSGLVNRISHAELLKLESFGQTKIFDSVSQSSRSISQVSHYLGQTLSSAVLAAAILVYIAVINPLTSALLVCFIVVFAWQYFRMGGELEARREKLTVAEDALFEGVKDLFDGFKEQKLNSARSEGLNVSYGQDSGSTMAARNEFNTQRWRRLTFGELCAQLMIGIVVFIVPSYVAGFGEGMGKITSSVVFLCVPILALVHARETISDAENAAREMLEMDALLSELIEAGSELPVRPLPADFWNLKMENAGFTFPTQMRETPFSVGPFNLTLRRGETVFITGGNGAGKSTFVKLLCGLYTPCSGQILMDDLAIGPGQRAAWRELFSVVFADYHLFNRLYGTVMKDDLESQRLMRWLEIEKITELKDGQFTRSELSGGQRKRLALVAALLEHKPILILDEWAADQDPYFRRKFYREIIPSLKEQGLTVIAVTHDDHYFYAADRLLHLEEGRLTELPVPPVPVGSSE